MSINTYNYSFIYRNKERLFVNIYTFHSQKKGCIIIMKNVNNKDRLQIFKINNLISNIIANVEKYIHI